jgi:hypothetical protein
MHQFFGGATGLSASCVEDRRVWFFVADIAGKRRKPNASLETAPLRIAVPIRHQPEEIPMKSRKRTRHPDTSGFLEIGASNKRH